MVNINKYIKALLHPAGGHQGSHKAHQAGNQNKTRFKERNMGGLEPDRKTIGAIGILIF